MHYAEARKTWMDQLLEYFREYTNLEDTKAAKRLKQEASKYTLVERTTRSSISSYWPLVGFEPLSSPSLRLGLPVVPISMLKSLSKDKGVTSICLKCLKAIGKPNDLHLVIIRRAQRRLNRDILHRIIPFFGRGEIHFNSLLWPLSGGLYMGRSNNDWFKGSPKVLLVKETGPTEVVTGAATCGRVEASLTKMADLTKEVWAAFLFLMVLSLEGVKPALNQTNVNKMKQKTNKEDIGMRKHHSS
ncbi:hypothetical protein CR513_56146, partial [Mucuna pruriens]